jgi:tetratricopeptide (TPR) repeat protein
LLISSAFAQAPPQQQQAAPQQPPSPQQQRPAPQPQPQQKEKEELLDRTPFDLIILKEAGKTLEVTPLDLPQRPPTSIPPGPLRIRLLERPIEEFEVALADIAKIRIFEEQLLDEARRLTAAGDFDTAYDYFGRMLRDYPSYPGLNDAISDYLRRNALALYQSNQPDRALAVLLSLHQRDPRFAGLGGAVSTVASNIIERYLRDGKYAAARGVLELWQTQFKGLADDAAAEWQRRFETAATRQLDDAVQSLQEKNYIAARSAVSKALGIWPKLAAAANVTAQIEREFPFVTVGVLEQTPRDPQRRIDSWPAMRGSRLTQHLLAEEVDFGAEGGVYRSPFGKIEPDETGRALTLTLDPLLTGKGPAALTPDSLARYLLSTTRPNSPMFRPVLAQHLSGVAISPDSVQIQFSRVQVRPESMLQIAPPVGGQRFSIAEYGPEQIVFAAPQTASSRRSALRAIVEKTYADDDAAVAALVAGDIDILDRVPPWQLDKLGATNGVRVESYKLPTVHMLVPNIKRPLPAKREFRRALCFGIDRKFILQSVLLGGTQKPGFEVISGPFPAGASLSDPLRYAYNNRVAPRPYEPRLAAILATVAWAAVQNPSGKKEDAPAELPDLPELTLAHPKDPIIRIACQSIQMQLARAGIRIKLVEFAPDELLAGKVEYDLRYAEVAVWEPLTDTRALLGSGGLAGDLESPYLQSALRALDDATNWNDVRARLAEVHEIASHELPLIPLWQTVNYFAYRGPIDGIGESPVALYQNVESWSHTPGSDVSRLQATSP